MMPRMFSILIAACVLMGCSGGAAQVTLPAQQITPWAFNLPQDLELG